MKKLVGHRAKETDWEEEEEKKKRRERIIANMSIISNQEWDAGSSWEMIKLGRPSRTNGRKRHNGNSAGRLLCTAEDTEWMNKNCKTQSFQ